MFTNTDQPGRTLSSFNSVATTIMVTEGNNENFNNWQIEPTDFFNQYRMFAGHLTTSNYLFADGHVKALKPTATVDGTSGGSSSVNMWRVDNQPFSTTTRTTVRNVLTFAGNRYN